MKAKSNMKPTSTDPTAGKRKVSPFTKSEYKGIFLTKDAQGDDIEKMEKLIKNH